MADVTRILSEIENGDPSAAEQLLPLVYEELRKLAAQKLIHEKPGQTLQATALVHEAYLRLVDVEKVSAGTAGGISSQPRPRPCGAILIENARAKDSCRQEADRPWTSSWRKCRLTRDTFSRISSPSMTPSTSWLCRSAKAELVKLRSSRG